MAISNCVFVILHYQNKLDTEECIESLLALEGNFNIVVVDNSSPNNSGKQLSEKYHDLPKVDVLLLERNLGFANGNNRGCMFAMERYNPKFLIVINNDTFILQKDFISKLTEAYRNLRFDILGPRIIITKTGEDQNPVYHILSSKDEIHKRIMKFKVLVLLNHVYLEKIFRSIFAFAKNVLNEGREEKTIKRSNYRLHGSAMIFTRAYFTKFGNIFDPETFMYCEEDLLQIRVENHKLKAVFYKDLEIFHKDDSSTETVHGKGRKKRLFYYQESIKSLKILLKKL